MSSLQLKIIVSAIIFFGLYIAVRIADNRDVHFYKNKKTRKLVIDEFPKHPTDRQLKDIYHKTNTMEATLFIAGFIAGFMVGCFV